MTDIIKRPVLSEKAQALQSKGQYSFVVDLKANKIQVKKAIEALYSVKVKEVQTLRQIGFKRSRSTKAKVTSGMTSTWKKAIVTLAKGEFMDIYANI